MDVKILNTVRKLILSPIGKLVIVTSLGFLGVSVTINEVSETVDRVLVQTAPK